MVFYQDSFKESTVTPKLHMLEEHVIPWLRQWRIGFGFMGEEGIHAAINKTDPARSDFRKPHKCPRWSCATKPRPHATSKAKNGRGCFLPFFRFQHPAGFIFKRPMEGRAADVKGFVRCAKLKRGKFVSRRLAQSNTCTGSHGDRAKPHSSDTPPHSAAAPQIWDDSPQ